MSAAPTSLDALVPHAEALAVFGVDTVTGAASLRPRPLGATLGVWRVHAGDTTAILKLLRLDASTNVNWATSANPDHPRWWRRELAILDGGVADSLRPEFRPPGLLYAGERSDGSLALWLEDLGPPTTWTVEALVDVARLLGAAQAKASRHLPDGLVSGFLRAYLEPRADHLAEPYLSERDELLARLDAMPQTVCHFDFHPSNVFRLEAEIAVIDWAYCGSGPIGTDAGVLVADALATEIVPAHESRRLVREVWQGYCEGLADETLANDAAEVYAMGTALRYAWLQAWAMGQYGPPLDEQRRIGVMAAYQAFGELAADRL